MTVRKKFILLSIFIFFIVTILSITITFNEKEVEKSNSNNSLNVIEEKKVDIVLKKLKINKKTPDFSSFKDVKQKKNEFFEFIYPMVVNNNLEIIEQRKLIETSIEFNEEIKELCKYYRIECNKNNYKGKFLKQVNIIPASLTLAQAANESAWGTSRFARKANNYFGQWCFTKGCGIVPKKRSGNAQHEVQSFKYVYDSVKSYVRNLNSHPAYKELRDIRNKEGFSGKKLAKGLSKYSERGEHYIKEIQSMISYNKLQKYDQKMAKFLNIEWK